MNSSKGKKITLEKEIKEATSNDGLESQDTNKNRKKGISGPRFRLRARLEARNDSKHGRGQMKKEADQVVQGKKSAAPIPSTSMI